MLTKEQELAHRKEMLARELEERRAVELKAAEVAARHGIGGEVASRLIAGLEKLLQSPSHRAFACEILAENDNSAEPEPEPEPEQAKDDHQVTKEGLAAKAQELYGETLDRRLSIEKMQARLDELAEIAGA